MSHDHHTQPFPRGALFAAAGVIALTITAAAAGRMSGITYNAPTAAPVVARDLLFQDRPNGAVAVFEASNPSAPIAMIAPETNGFLRATMRGLARQRLRQDADRQTPFRLTQWADGRLTLEDPTTHRSVEMEAFGISNEQAFAQLLTAKAGS